MTSSPPISRSAWSWALGAAALLLALQPAGFLAYLPLVAGLMVIAWLYSLVVDDLGAVDLCWGPAFALVTWAALWYAPGVAGPREILIATLVSVWAARLAAFLVWRARCLGEVESYRALRAAAGERWLLHSLLRVFLPQALILWLVAAPTIAALQGSPVPGLAWLDGLGVLLWVIGFGIESLADWQLARHKAAPGDPRRALTRGLWRHWRHPNYVGDILVHWGLFCFAAACGAWIVIVAPVLMTLLLLEVNRRSRLAGQPLDRAAGFAMVVGAPGHGGAPPASPP